MTINGFIMLFAKHQPARNLYYNAALVEALNGKAALAPEKNEIEFADVYRKALGGDQ